MQDSRVEGHELTSSYENTKITTNWWTTIDRKMLEPTNKDILCPKTKKKPQQDGRRSTTAIKANPIPAGWVTHKLENNYIAEVLPQEWKFWPQVMLPSLAVWQWDEEPPENLALKASGILLQEFHSTRGNRNSTLGGHTQGLVHTTAQDKKQWPHNILGQSNLLILESLQQR